MVHFRGNQDSGVRRCCSRGHLGLRRRNPRRKNTLTNSAARPTQSAARCHVVEAIALEFQRLQFRNPEGRLFSNIATCRIGDKDTEPTTQ